MIINGKTFVEPPKIGVKYVKNDLGQFEMRMDFRSNPEEHDYEVRPRVSPGQLYTDEEFPLWVAMGKDPNRKTLEWKRPRVSVSYSYYLYQVIVVMKIPYC